MSNKRKTIDTIYQTFTFLASFFAILALGLIFMFVLNKGIGLLNWDLVVSDYHAKYYNGGMPESLVFSDTERLESFSDEVYYSEKWGLALIDGKDKENNTIVEVYYVAENSPLNEMIDKNENDYDNFGIHVGDLVTMIKFNDGMTSAISSWGAQNMITQLDSVDEFREIVFTTEGGGIRGSIITTMYLIGLTLIFALPIGIFTAIYLNEFAKKNRITNVLRSMIELLTGVPSIVFGLMGLAVFVPLTVKYTSATSGNILSGSLTLAVILLPVIIRSTEESLKVVPDGLRSASLALGANHTQTTFKVVLPGALPGIITGTLLAIGRIIGESAALIFAIGTAVKDDISIFGKSTSLAVHIWSLMSDEPANIELASTIALIILIIVLTLNLTVKLVTSRFMKSYH
jgi:phosphate transport system permease protein